MALSCHCAGMASARTPPEFSEKAGNMKATYQTGLMGEEIAEEYLCDKGMRCLEKRHREKCGEIDLIMEEDQTLVFVEVKARFSEAGPGEGLRSVTPSKQKKIARAAMLYLLAHGWERRAVRFDVIEVNPEGILHIPNAFQPGGIRF